MAGLLPLRTLLAGCTDLDGEEIRGVSLQKQWSAPGTEVWAMQVETGSRSGRLKFQDLNVSTSEGVQTLYGRIHAAAWHVCATTSSDPVLQMSARSCARNALPSSWC